MGQKPSRASEQPQQPTLFGGWASVHDAVTTAGSPKQAVEAAQVVALAANAGSLPKALAGRSGRQIADTAASALVRDLDGSGERGYSYSAWCLAGLPHREIPKDADWLIETGFARLLVRPGRRLRDDNSREDIGVPFGSFARLLLVELQSAALETSSREITLERSASALVARIGVARGGPTNAKVANQLERLATCSVDFTFGDEKKGVIVNQRLVEAAEYIAMPDARARGSLRVIERVLLSEAFYKELCRHPVLIDKSALHDLASSPLAIDIYLWLAFRLHVLQKELPVGWDALHRQFGARVGLLKNFKSQFMAPLHLALSAYSAAKVRVGDRGLLLEPSAPPLRA